jgi:hypothetical protein
LLEDKTVDFKTLTLRELMSPEHAVSHYTSEEPLFSKLLNGPYGQIAFYDVLSAYFENHDPHALRGERSLMLKQLYAKLDAAWGGYDTIAPVIHGADNENWGGPDHEPGKVAYAKAFMRLINLHIERTADNT